MLLLHHGQSLLAVAHVDSNNFETGTAKLLHQRPPAWIELSAVRSPVAKEIQQDDFALIVTQLDRTPVDIFAFKRRKLAANLQPIVQRDPSVGLAASANDKQNCNCQQFDRMPTQFELSSASG